MEAIGLRNNLQSEKKNIICEVRRNWFNGYGIWNIWNE